MEPNRARYRVEVVKPAFLEPDGGALPEAQIAVYENCGWEYVASRRMLHFFRALVVVMFSGGAPVPGAGGGAAGGRAAGRYAPVAGWLVEGGMEAVAVKGWMLAHINYLDGAYSTERLTDVLEAPANRLTAYR